MRKMLLPALVLACVVAYAQGPPTPFPGNGTPQGELKRSLRAYYKHDEIGNVNRMDSKDRFDLINPGGVFDVPGVVGLASKCDGTATSYLQAASTVVPDASNFTLWGWVNFGPPTPTIAQVVLSEGTGGLPNTGRFRIFALADRTVMRGQISNGVQFFNADVTGPIVQSQWYFFMLRYDDAAKLLTFDVPALGPQANVATSGSLNPIVQLFTTCATSDVFGRLIGSVDEVGVAEERLSDAIRDQLAVGVTYPTF